MSTLISLLEKYKQDLAIPWTSGSEGIENTVQRYAAFGAALAELPSFSYGQSEMRAVVGYMMASPDPEFSKHARYAVVGHAMRRAAMDEIPDATVRQDISQLFDMDILALADDTKYDLAQAVAGFAAKREPEAQAYFSKVQEGLSRMKQEVQTLNDAAVEMEKLLAENQAYAGSDEKELLRWKETAENHNNALTVIHSTWDEIVRIMKNHSH